MCDDQLDWIEAEGYHLALDGSEIVCRNAKGTKLKTVPAKARKTGQYQELLATRDFLDQHTDQCKSTVLAWFLAGEEIPVVLLGQVWTDPAWRHWLEDLVVCSSGTVGLLKGADENNLHLVDLDGESVTVTVTDTAVATIPHPAGMVDIDDWREFAVELGVHQNLDQLLREIHPKPADEKTQREAVRAYDGGVYEQASHLLGRGRGGGFKTSLQEISVTVTENGVNTTAVLDVTAWSPEDEATLGTLGFTRSGRTVALADVGPVAWSEGIRMAEYIYSARTKEKDTKN
ncbi:DUF4132 domain-containing protein [Corynebacterium sp. CCM 8862]|uniref:DUF4132 domain-containing protein n=1 Tax=Corynebacterium mendelii TaxID=2765362 RepID=A0A939DYK1_9CORY|nr:DUF4132 domain-containing protein [Corynebacterium mendelii]